ncbi:MAG: DUF4313 domain-containing protein [Fibrobacter sp.]|nr:DUF4313 domain-containing protein [Fibrobacter sp.]
MANMRKLEFVRSKYDFSKTLAVMANNKDGSPYEVATVYIEGQSDKLGPDEAFVNTNDWPNVEEVLIKAKLAERIDKAGVSGFCVYPAMKFKLDKIRDLNA